MLCALAALAFLTSPFWLAGLGGYLVRASAPVPADLVVVLAGDFTGHRILTGADLVRHGYAPQALISGPSGAYGMYECDLAIQFAVRHGYPKSYFIRLPNEARSTREEAAVIVAALRQRNAHRVDVVTGAPGTFCAPRPRESTSIWWPLRTKTSAPAAGGRTAKGARLFCWNG